MRKYIQIEGMAGTKPVEPVLTAKSRMKVNIGMTSAFESKKRREDIQRYYCAGNH